MAPAQDAGCEDDQQARFHEEFAGVEPVDRGIFQGWVGEQAVPEERGGGEVDGEVKGFPEAAAKAEPRVGSNHDNGDNVEGHGADGVLEGLAGRMDGVEEIENAELCGFVEQKNEGMKDREAQRDIPGNIVQAEVVQVAMRPLAHRAVPESHEGAEEHVESDGAYGGEADVGGEVQDGEVRGHCVIGRASAKKGNAGKKNDGSARGICAKRIPG